MGGSWGRKGVAGGRGWVGSELHGEEGGGVLWRKCGGSMWEGVEMGEDVVWKGWGQCRGSGMGMEGVRNGKNWGRS